MKKMRLVTSVSAALLALALAVAQQQPFVPHLAYAFPAGCRAGSSVEIKVGGQFLQGATGAYVSGQGVRVTVGEYYKPMTQNQVQQLAQKMQDAREKLIAQGVRVGPQNSPAAILRVAQEAGVTEEQLREMDLFRRRRNDPKRQPNPQIEETVTLKIEVEPQALPGIREVRLMSPLGLTNPVWFEVGTLADVYEDQPPEVGAVVPLRPGAAGQRQLLDAAAPAKGPQAIEVPMPFVINGQVMPGQVDRYALNLQQGKQIVIAASARDLIPYLADAVPGWFQATLSLRNARGEEVAFADRRGTYQDPVLAYKVAESGEYVLEIRDAIYRGREDFVYRVAVGELMYVTSIFPLGHQAGVAVSAEMKGWNLLATHLGVMGGSADSGLPHMAPAGFRTVPFAIGALKEATQKEPNDDAAHAQFVVTPCTVNGRIDKPGDVDVYRVTGKKGEKLVVEIEARQLGSSLDSMVAVADTAGKPLGVGDDFVDKGQGLVTHQADSYLSLTLPADGSYFVTVRDAQQQGGVDYGYRLRLSPPMPSFDLRVTPSSLTLRPGLTVPITVHVLRRDGFDGPISASLAVAPNGFRLYGGVIPQGIETIRMTLTAPAQPMPEPARLGLVGSAAIGGKEVVRWAGPAEDMMQAFAYRHLVPQQQWLAAVVGRANPGMGLRVPEEAVRIPAGGTVKLKIEGPGPFLMNRLRVSLSDPPEGLTIAGMAVEGNALVVTVRADGGKAKAGLKGNLIFDAFLDPVPAVQGANRDAPAAQRPAVQRRQAVGQLPAIPFEIVKA